MSRLRRALGSEVIHGGRQGYQLGDLAVVVDLDEAAWLTDRAERELESTPALARTAAGHAVGLLSAGTALAEEPYAAWAEPARDELRGLLRRARHAYARAVLVTSDAHLAARVAEDAMADDPYQVSLSPLAASARVWLISGTGRPVATSSGTPLQVSVRSSASRLLAERFAAGDDLYENQPPCRVARLGYTPIQRDRRGFAQVRAHSLV